MKYFSLFILAALAGGKPSWVLSQKGNEYTLSKSKIEKQFKDPAKLLADVTLKFLPAQDKNLRVELSQLRKGNVLEPIGLRKGDILKTVNGEGVSLTAFFDKQTPKAWVNKKRYVLELERNGKPETLIYNVQ
jgi:hypothetical protein